MKPLLLVFLATTSGAGAQSSDVETGVLVLTPRIKTALFSERTLDSSNINGNTHGLTRTVTLSGAVTWPGQEFLAETITQKNAAGCQVHNESLRFQPTKSGAAPRYQRVGEFLRLLSVSKGQSAPDDGRKIAFSALDVNRLVSFVSRRGLLIVDANENNARPHALSWTQLKRDLKRTGSSVFDSFAFAAQDIRLQRSVPSSRATAKGVVISLPSGLSFLWEREGAARTLFLRKLEYLPAPS